MWGGRLWLVVFASPLLQGLCDEGKCAELGSVNSPVPVLNTTWAHLGPFPVGKTEVDGDPVFSPAAGGLAAQRVSSELVVGGSVGWILLQAKRGQVTLQYPMPGVPVDFNRVVQATNRIATLEFQSWLVNKFVVHTEQAGRVLLKCTPVHTVWLDDHQLLAGDIYNNPFSSIPITLSPGKHTLLVHLKARGAAGFKCAFRRAPSPVEAFTPIIPMPDLVDGRLISGLCALPVANYVDGWTGPLTVTIHTLSHSSPRVLLDSQRVQKPLSLGPGQFSALAIPIQLDSSDIHPDWWSRFKDNEPCIRVRVSVTPPSLGSYTSSVELSLRCRSSAQSFSFNYVDRDGTVVTAAAIPPQSPQCAICPVILACSGVGATALSQADSFKHAPILRRRRNAAYDFGHPQAWVLAPERYGAHNWEGVGYHTLLSAVEGLAKFSRLFGVGADVNRIVYVGHSRGGHGALQLGTQAPDRAVGVISIAGWYKREEYGDANMLFQSDTQLAHADPRVTSIESQALCVE